MLDYDLRLLVIDDDITQLALLDTLISHFSQPKCLCDFEVSPLKALALLKKYSYDLVLTDYKMAEMNGLQVFEEIKAYNPHIPVVIMTAVSDIELAISMMREGVYDYLVKPVKSEVIMKLLYKVDEHCQLEKEIRELRERIHQDFSIDSIIGNSQSIKRVIDVIGRCSGHSVSVLIRGESGTGKELAAYALHYSSPRADGPFVIVNIAALSESLIESELFGHVKGAFTGADKDRAGRFEEAHGGTLFIDEIGDINPSIQVKLLRAIQFRQFQRIGENQTRIANVRIITATSRNLEQMMADGGFRSDLYYRLNVVEITIPPLRDRKEDIPLLIKYFYKKLREENALEKKQFSREAMDMLISYSYPGNVRELQNIVEHAVVFSRGQQISSRDLPSSVQKNIQERDLIADNLSSMEELDYENQMARFERELLTAALEEAEGNQSEAARRLGMTERRLRYRIEKLGIQK
jgi:two-component system, NtrC family, response regulator HydG